jgi:inosine/xanthosine triphosphate pyrophosphatase family protein
MSDPVCSREIALASGNAHKLLEWQELLPSWRVVGLDMGGAPPESGDTFLEIALAKARYGATLQSARSWVLGEDSGLLVRALDGAPGIRSARYAGPQARDADNSLSCLKRSLRSSIVEPTFGAKLGLSRPPVRNSTPRGPCTGASQPPKPVRVASATTPCSSRKVKTDQSPSSGRVGRSLRVTGRERHHRSSNCSSSETSHRALSPRRGKGLIVARQRHMSAC